jgi:hypothetical protein
MSEVDFIVQSVGKLTKATPNYEVAFQGDTSAIFQCILFLARGGVDPAPSPYVITSTNVSLKAVQEFLKPFQGHSVEITFDIVDDLVTLATEFETEKLKAQFETWKLEHNPAIFLTEVKAACDRERLDLSSDDVAAKERLLRSIFHTLIESNEDLLLSYPVALLKRLISFPDLTNHIAFDPVFNFIVKYYHRYGPSGSLLLSGARLDSLTTTQLKALMSLEGFMWNVFGDSISEAICKYRAEIDSLTAEVTRLEDKPSTANPTITAIRETYTCTIHVACNQNLALAISGSSQDNTAPLIISEANGDDNQKFEFTNGRIVAVHSHKALDCMGLLTAGMQVVQNEPNDELNQQWSYHEDTQEIKSTTQNFVLDVWDGNTTPGTIVIARPPHNASCPKWIRRRI